MHGVYRDDEPLSAGDLEQTLGQGARAGGGGSPLGGARWSPGPALGAVARAQPAAEPPPWPPERLPARGAVCGVGGLARGLERGPRWGEEAPLCGPGPSPCTPITAANMSAIAHALRKASDRLVLPPLVAV